LDSFSTDEDADGETISYTERVTAGIPDPNEDEGADAVVVAADDDGVGDIGDRGLDKRGRTKSEGKEMFWKLSPRTMASPSSSCDGRAEGTPPKDADEDEAEDLSLSSRSRLNRPISLSSSPSGSVPARTITLVCIPEAHTIS